MGSFVALLRGINVGGNRLVPMAELRDVATGVGLGGVKTYIQSGNLVFTASGGAEGVRRKLEEGIRKRFGFDVDVVVRTKAAWAEHEKGNPFAAESVEGGKFVHLLLSKAPPKADAASALLLKAAAEERVVAVGDALWIHYPRGAGTTKLTPTLLDRFVGSPVTARNWRTVQEISKLLA